LDKSLEEGLLAHIKLVEERYEGGSGVEEYISEGFDKMGTGCYCCKLELGTWSERMTEMLESVQASQSYVSMGQRVEGIKRWWDLTEEFLRDNSSKLGDGVLKILAASQKGNIFPEGMDVNWALDVQSAQTLDFLAALQNKKDRVGWDLGTLTGVSAAVLSQHMHVTTVEREPKLVEFAKKNLPSEVNVVQSDIETFLQAQADAGTKADFIFMDLDKTCYQPCYELIRDKGLLAPGGVMLCDNVLYRGLVAQHRAGEMPETSEKTAQNAAALDSFLRVVQKDREEEKVKTLMLPVRDGMLALTVPLDSTAASGGA
jgi:predicted O-methyltransferase YrrM